MADHDFVTKVYNRNALDSHVSDLLASIHTTPTKAVYIQFDMDQFRLFNESLGCVAGDELLYQIANVIANNVGPKGFVARIGGDNFALVCECMNELEAVELVKYLQKMIAEYPFEWGDEKHELSATAAIVVLNNKVTRFEQLLMMADETLYLAKQHGRGSVLTYDENTPLAIDHRKNIQWALHLAAAIRNNQLRTYVQRMVPNKNDMPATKTKLEALVRLWDDATGRVVAPGEFIPVAERFDLVQLIDRWIVEDVARFLAEHRDLHEVIDGVSLNLSARTLNDPSLGEYILETVRKYNVSPELFIFEVTETERLVDVSAIQQFMTTLQAEGFRFALDDFGSGYSSFSYFHELPFNIVKIDGHLVHDLDRNGANAAITFSLVHIAKTLDKVVVLEGVENERVAEIINQGQDVEWCQGYYYHRPEPLTAEVVRGDWKAHLTTEQAAAA